ncbi:MAG: hypothetical protein DI585_01195 [Pseudomonas fluorescens]|nr:MAG: hypothetical protein DI585_01195 [Pseudomonas fluorescens]
MPTTQRKGEFPHHALTSGLQALTTGADLISDMPNRTELTEAEKLKFKTASDHLKAAHSIIDSIIQDRTPYPY